MELQGLGPDKAALAKRRARAQRIIALHQFLNILVCLIVEPTRIHLLRRLSPDLDATGLTARLTMWSTITGVSEFIFNPTLGRICDACGRRPCFMVAPLASTVLKTLFVLRPSAFLLGVEAIVCDGTRVMSGATVCSAALADILSGPELANAFSTQLAYSGLSVVVGPVIGSTLVSLTGSMYAPFAASAAMAAGLLTADYLMVKETLDPEERKPFEGFVNPLRVTDLFFSGNFSLTMLVCIFGLNCAVEPKNVSILKKMHNMQTLGMSQWMMSNMASLTGVGMFVQSPISRVCARMGANTVCFRSLANVFTSMGYALQGMIVTTWAALFGSICLFVGEGRSLANKGMAIDLAAKGGWGRGEFNGKLANLRALMGIASTLLYSRCYNAGFRRGCPSFSLFVPALVSAITEVLCRIQAAASAS